MQHEVSPPCCAGFGELIVVGAVLSFYGGAGQGVGGWYSVAREGVDVAGVVREVVNGVRVRLRKRRGHSRHVSTVGGIAALMPALRGARGGCARRTTERSR